MQLITLSDHVSDRLQAIEGEREMDYQMRLAFWEGEIRRIDADYEAEKKRYEAERARIKDMFKNKRYIRWFFSLLFCSCKKRGRYPSKPLNNYYASDEENKLRSGNEGERQIDQLFSVTPDNFNLIAGYKSYKGEIDRVLVCPQGVLAIEIKNYNGTIYIDGDNWTLNKYDKYGNLVETGVIMQDNGGRSPSQQVNQSTDPLERFLSERHPKIKKVARAVLLTHDRAAIGAINNPTINCIAEASKIKWNGMETIMPNRDDRLSDQEIQEVVNLIKRDHEYCAKRSDNYKKRRD